MAATPRIPGQRWVSDSEPELGLGILVACADGRVELRFPAAGETRLYAAETAPLRRVAFSPGDVIQTRAGTSATVTAVRETGGLLVYQTDRGELPEAELSDAISFSKPEDRLFGGVLDDPSEFDLRGEALHRRAAMRRSPLRGLVGGRIDLIPHQLFIADEVSRRLHPRVLLADEVGLGKTIEACLILHRLLLTGQVSRVLLLVPGPLLHQWFVELLRRFHLSFSLFDEERCRAIEQGDPGGNPFLDSEWVLCATDWLAASGPRARQAVEAGWDLLLIDEAHHLTWTPGEPGAAYQVAALLAARTAAVLLLTATPQQLGPEGHFARLRLLDPQRYADLDRYRREVRQYEAVADAVAALERGELPLPAVHSLSQGLPRLGRNVSDLLAGRPGSRATVVANLLDRCGIGRVMFRNTRRTLGGFPAREPHFHPLDRIAKTAWLAEWAARLPSSDKALVIVRTRELAEQVLEELRQRTGLAAVPFHEGLSLLQRDRHAAFFADEDGSRILVCSEIGGEGRNFQFARHLVLLDLPADLDLLEQRIGRLDRIGRRGTIHLHIPYARNSPEETHVRWLDEGLDAFRASTAGLQKELAPFLGRAWAHPEALPQWLSETRSHRQRLKEQLARGYEPLLERSSHQPARASQLADAIRRQDEDRGWEDFLLRLFEHCGLHIEELGDRRYFLLPGNLKSDAFPALPPAGLTVTLDRQRALEREQEAFLTWDHPLVRAALDLLLGSEAGNASFALWEAPGEKRLILESWIILEAVAPAAWHIERFLPPTPLRIVIDHRGNEEPAFTPPPLRKGNPSRLLRNQAFKQQVLPSLLATVRALGAERGQETISSALSAMHAAYASERSRLADLAALNDHIRPAELEHLAQREHALDAAIRAARVRLDAVRLIWKAPPGGPDAG